MDTPATPEPNNPVTPSGPKAPHARTPAEPETWSAWFKANSSSILFTGIAITLVLMYLNVWDVIKVAIGLGLVIFIHELGHFLAAKWCDVHVETFSIGFGNPIPGCQFRYGETTYKIGWIPLGGYVKMVGEGENADTEEAEEDPRSFKNKPVGQRMLIISAGVIMNMLLAAICFVVVYSHGVEEKPPIIGWVEAGSPAWQEGIQSEMILEKIDDLDNPVFDDVRPIVMGTSKGEIVTFQVKDDPKATPRDIKVEPGRDSEALFPVVGVGPTSQLTLIKSRRPEARPTRLGSKAAECDPPFQLGDQIIASSVDPANPSKVEPIPVDERPGAAGKLDYFEFLRRQHEIRGKPMIVRVKRGAETKDITIAPAYTYSSGLRMGMGRVAGVRRGSPAADPDKGLQPRKGEETESGDKILYVKVADFDADTGKTSTLIWSNEPAADLPKLDVQKPLDPLRLPFELELWADRQKKQKEPNWTVELSVLRPTAGKQERNQQKHVKIEITWDDSARYRREIQTTPNSPLSIPCLGLAYHVEAVVEEVQPDSPGARAGLQKGDVIKEIRGKYITPKGQTKEGEWQKIKVHQWAYVFAEFQYAEPKEFQIRFERAGEGGLKEAMLQPEEDLTWPAIDRGLLFQVDTRLHKADDLLDAMRLGMHRTVRTVRVIYQNLYAMFFGRVSLWTMSGPLTIADVSYRIAGENLWQFILFIGMINVNLAVINFLPIPVLDGGHMVFLIYEKIRGKPAPEAVFAAAMWIGLALILSLMCFVIFLDVKRLFF